MAKLFTIWLAGLVLLAPHPSVLLWFWVAAPVVALPLALVHWLTSRR